MSYFGDEMTRGGFVSHMGRYIEQLMKNPSSADVDDYLKNHGITSEKALEMLLKKADKNNPESAILIRKEKIKTGDDGKDIFCVTYKLPDAKNYRKKMRNLYIMMFESNIVKGCPINEGLNYYEMPLSSTPSPFKSGEKIISQCKPGSTGDRFARYVNNNDKNYTPQMFTDEDELVKEIEAMDKDNAYKNRGGLNKPVVKEMTDCASTMQDGGNNPDAGQYSVPYGGKKKGQNIITRTFAEGRKRTVYMTEDQVKYIKKKTVDEATTTFNATSAGNAMGDMTPPGAFTDAETANHKNICVDKNLMNGGVTGKNAN